MQQKDIERLQKMGTSSLQQADRPHLQSRKKRSFSLPSFRRSSASAGERQEVVTIAKEAARVQKAAAWQWYTRGVADAVLPTKRPQSPPSQAPMDDKIVVDGSSKGGESIIMNKNNVLQKKPLEPPLAQPQRAASRFKSEASFARAPTSGTLSVPSAAPSTPLYDEFELSGLRSQMADFVQRLQQHQTKDNDKSTAVADHQKAKSLRRAAVDGGSLPAAAASAPSTDQPPPSAAAAMATYNQLTKPPPASAVPVPFRMRPFSALHRLFRKVVSGSIIKSTANSPVMIISSPEVNEPKVHLPVEEEELSSQYHYHHYIHHHHHHYHYGQSPEESAAIIRSRRRHSESSGIRPLIPSPGEEELSDEEEEALQRSPIKAYLARRRRHSDSFAEHLTAKKAALDEEEEMKGKSAKAALPLQVSRRYNSERFLPNKIPTMDSKELAQPAAGGEDELDEGLMHIKIRRHSTENNREGEAMERKAEGARKSGTYKLSESAADGATPTKSLVRRRHSEGLQRPEGVQYEMGKRTPSPGRSYWYSPSARYVEDVLERQIGASAATNAAPARRPRPPRDLPPIYPL